MEFELPEELAEVQHSPTISATRKSRRAPRKMTENIALAKTWSAKCASWVSTVA
jgi:hypothetical protein